MTAVKYLRFKRDTQAAKRSNWNMMLIILNFSIIFNGSVMLWQHYEHIQRVEFVYYILFALVTILVVRAIAFISKNSSIGTKACTTALLYLSVIVLLSLLNK